MSAGPAEWFQIAGRRRSQRPSRRWALAALFTMITATANAQDACSHGHSSANWRHSILQNARQIFVAQDSSSTLYRQRHDITVPDTTRGRIVADRPTCKLLQPAVRKAVKQLNAPDAPLSADQFDLVHFQFANYYAVLLVPPNVLQSASPDRPMGYVVLLIFRAETFEYVGFVLNRRVASLWSVGEAPIALVALGDLVPALVAVRHHCSRRAAPGYGAVVTTLLIS